MGDIKVAETFIDCVFITDTATGAPALLLAPTCTFVKAADNTRTAGTVAELGSGWYKCTDFASDAAGTWLTEWAVAGAYTIHYPYKEFKAGGGLIADVGTVVDNIHDTDLPDVHTDVGTCITAAGTAAAYSIVNSGLGFRGIVTAAVAGVSFTVGTLAGLGAGLFLDATSPWYAYVLRDAGGASAAPQGDYRKVTGYTTASGLFTTAAFSAAVDVGDDVIIISNVLWNIIDTKTDTATIRQRTDNLLVTRAFFSPSLIVATVDTSHTDIALPSVTLPNIAGVIVHVYAGVKFRMVENMNVAANKLNGAQEIQVRVDTPGAWADCINFVDHQFGVAASTREGGDCIVGYTDLVGTVTAFNDIYEFQWDEPLSEVDSLLFNDVQTFLIVSYH
jgi:hypothetical protein